MASRGGVLPGKFAAFVLAPALAATGIAYMPLSSFTAPGRGGHTIQARIGGRDPGGSEVSHGWTPRMQRVVDLVRREWPGVSCGGQADGSETGHIPGSDHYTGNAADCTAGRYGVRAAGSAKKTGDAVAAWAVGHAAELHVSYIIWYARINTGSGWTGYCDQLDPSCSGVTYEHFDHVHISVVH